MKRKTYIAIISIVLISNICSFIIGRYDIYWAKDCHPDGSESIWYPHAYDMKEALLFERQYANALLEGLHRFYSNDDNDEWFNSFVFTKEYQRIDSLNNHDWEDFYHYETEPLEDWFTNYGVVNEPSTEYKDTVSSEHVRRLQESYQLALYR